jgi:hypothetical protein
VTVNVALVFPLLPSTTATSLIESDGGGSSSRIVPRPLPSAIVALTGFERTTVYVSSTSSSTSPFTCTITVCNVSPGGIVSVPLVD